MRLTVAGKLQISPLRASRSGRDDGFVGLGCAKLHGVGVCLVLLTCFRLTLQAQTPYSVPAADAKVLRGVDFGKAVVVDPELTTLYQACDANRERGGCYTDQAKNTAVLRFADGTVFFDAKMAIDADGSVLSKKAERPNQPGTAFRYPDPTGVGVGPSLDSERVPYVVMPMGDFRRETGVSVGDLAAVMKDGKVQFAIVGDVGPRTHIGEGSMKLHVELGHSICTAYDEDHNCSAFTDVSIDPPVLYFVFPDTRKLIYDGLTPENIDKRVAASGQKVWREFLAGGGGVRVAGVSPGAMTAR